MRTWTLRIPAPCPWLTTPPEATRTQHSQIRAAYVRRWRSRTYVTAVAAHGLPRGLLRVRVDAVLHFLRPGRRTPADYEPTVQACLAALAAPVDGRVPAPGYQLIPEAATPYVDGPHIVEGDLWRPASHAEASARVPGRLDLTITALEGAVTEPDLPRLAEMTPGGLQDGPS